MKQSTALEGHRIKASTPSASGILRRPQLLRRHGGETIGQYGHSKDHRPDRVQMVVGVVLDGQGRPLCCELWPGNIADGKLAVERVRQIVSGGRPDEVQAQAQRLEDGQGVLDAVRDQAKRLQTNVGIGDRERLDEYFTSVRELEQRLTQSAA